MENEKEMPKRKPPRWQERDYNTPGGYFITICTQDKRCILSPVPTNIARSNNTCSQFVSTLKRFCNKAYGQNIWQARYYDHIIRDHRDPEEHVAYIGENPLGWTSDPLYV